MFALKDLASAFGGLISQRGTTFSMPKPRRRSSYDSRSSLTSPSSAGGAGGRSSVEQRVFEEDEGGEREAETVANAVCQWEYVAETDAEVSMAAGERVLVLSRSDNTGNPEWFGVRKADGLEGFVPAAFLRDVDVGGEGGGGGDTFDEEEEDEEGGTIHAADNDLAKIARFSEVSSALTLLIFIAKTTH